MASTNDLTQRELRIGVDVGGTFTDLVAFDGRTLHVHKIPSTPPNFDMAVAEAVDWAAKRAAETVVRVVHGSTVATNALLERRGEPIAFVTTSGFADMLLIGRQNRPELYAFNIQRPRPLALDEHCFTLAERIGANGEVVEELTSAEVDRVVGEIVARGLKHVAVCLLFSFVNPVHEQRIGRRCAEAGLTVSLSSDVLPEFREYERASTTAINASLRPTVQSYLNRLETALSHNLPPERRPDDLLRIMHSGGGTLSAVEAGTSAARLVLSGPAGGVLGAAFVAQRAGFADVITYDMGGTSTDVAVIQNGRPQWTTAGVVDGLPLALPAFDIATVGAGGGSVAELDAGGALRVGPRSAGAVPGPACYGRGGEEPTVTDANVVLGRIAPHRFAGGTMPLDVDRARSAMEAFARRVNKSIVETALGVVRVAEANMAHAIRNVTARRGHDPRRFTLVSFGGAGGLHACALAEALDIPRVLVPPCCGVLSALGMAVAPAVADAGQTVLQLDHAGLLDDARIAAECGRLNSLTMDRIPYDRTAAVEVYADVRFRGQSHEVKVRFERPSREHIFERFRAAYEALYGPAPAGRMEEIVTLRVRRVGHAPKVDLPVISPDASTSTKQIELFAADGSTYAAPLVTRAQILAGGELNGPAVLTDAEATTYVPPGWRATATRDGTVTLMRGGESMS